MAREESNTGAVRNSLETRLARFSLSQEEAISLDLDFRFVLSDCEFTKSPSVSKALAKHKSVPGIYFWLLHLGEARYKIYIGHTTSLSYRLTNYISDFQPHSPNDYKLRIFHGFVAEAFPSAGLDLYFASMDFGNVSLAGVRAQLTHAENTALAKYKPVLLNSRGRASVESKTALMRAFSSYYRSAFEAILKG